MPKKQAGFIIFVGVILSSINVWGILFVYGKAIDSFTVPYMVTYQGPTISISGSIIYENYDSGSIFVIAKRTPRKVLIPDIAIEELAFPGAYTIKVPVYLDKVYIQAVNSKVPYKGVAFSSELPHSSYVENPIRLKQGEDLDNIDIVISATKPPWTL